MSRNPAPTPPIALDVKLSSLATFVAVLTLRMVKHLRTEKPAIQ